jgi:hypothetical protein
MESERMFLCQEKNKFLIFRMLHLCLLMPYEQGIKQRKKDNDDNFTLTSPCQGGQTEYFCM